MKTIQIHKLLAVLSAALLLAVNAAQAGPGPHELYHPVMSMKVARALPVGETIAISCGNCGGVSAYIVDKDRSYLHGFTCPLCKREFHVSQPGGGGRAVAMGHFVYVDKGESVAHLAAKR
jgi:hypothetical protein